MTLAIADLELIVGESNLFEIDLNTDLDPQDEVWFTAKYRRADADADAAIRVTRSGGGIVDVNTGEGKCQVKLTKALTEDLTGRALLYDVKVEKVDQDPDLLQTVARGAIILIHPVNRDASP